MSKLLDDLAAILGDGLLQTETERSARARDTWIRSQIPVSAGSPVVPPRWLCAPRAAAKSWPRWSVPVSLTTQQ